MSSEPLDHAAGEMNFPLNHCVVKQSSSAVEIETAMVDVAVYFHRSPEGVEYLVIDLGYPSDDPFPLRVYRNDAPVYEEGL